MNDAGDRLAIMVLIVLFFGLGGALGIGIGSHLVNREAIKAGVAEWQVNPKTGETKFVWKGQAERSSP
jgi:hypothetical protein